MINLRQLTDRTRQIGLMLGMLLLIFMPPSALSQVVGKGYNNSLIYKIRSDTNTVYILGSLHALAEDFYPFTRAFSYAYYDSQHIIMEVDPKKLYSSKGRKYIEKISTFQNKMTLKKALTPKTYSLLKKHLKSMDLDIGLLKNFKPWKVYLTASGKRSEAAKDFSTMLGVENHFYQMAKDAGKTTGGLESMKEHFGVFNKLSYKDQDTLLRKALQKQIQDKNSGEEEFIHMTTSWHQGRLDELEKLVDRYKTNPIFYDTLLVKRNHKWIPKIEKFLKDSENYFIIVGVAHLPGEDGILNLLSQKGYTLERVSFARP